MNDLGASFCPLLVDSFLIFNYIYNEKIEIVFVTVVNSLLYQWFCTKTRFDTEAKVNCEIMWPIENKDQVKGNKRIPVASYINIID